MRVCTGNYALFRAALVALCVLLLPSQSRAQEAPTTVPRVVQVAFEPSIEGEDPWNRTGLRPGDSLDDSRVRVALRTALMTGTFSEARATLREAPCGTFPAPCVALLLRGERRVRARQIRFQGVRERALEQVRSELGIQPGAWVAEGERARALRRLLDAYHNSGWNQATATARWEGEGTSETRTLVIAVQEGPATRVRRVRFEGVPRQAEEAVAESAGISGASLFGIVPGDIADPRLARRVFDSVGRALHSVGYLTAEVTAFRFEPVSPALVDAVVSVRAGPRHRVQFEGVSWFSQRELERALRLGEERALDATTLSALALRVRDYYVRRGFLDAIVRAEVRPPRLPRPSHLLVFTVREGERTLLRRVLFPGCTGVPESQLREALTEVLFESLPGGELVQFEDPDTLRLFDGGIGFSSRQRRPRVRLEPARTYVPELFTEAARRMVNRYREAGHLDAVVTAGDPERVRNELNAPAVDVRFRCEEGPQTIFDEVLFEGNVAVPSRQLARAGDFRLGVPLSYPALEAIRARLLEHYRSEGYFFARIELAVDRSEDRRIARVRFQVHEGPLVRIRSVVMRGNERTDERMILERLALVPGDVFTPERARVSQRAVGETGFFSAVNVGLADPDVEAPFKDLLVEVTELPPYLEWRAGFSTGEGLRASFQYVNRNVLRSGITMTLQAQAGFLIPFPFYDSVFLANLNSLLQEPWRLFRGRVSASFTAPALPRVGRFAQMSLDVSAGRLIERQFAINSAAASVSTALRPLAAFTATPSVALQFNQLELLGIQSILDVIMNAPAGEVQRLSRLLLLPQGTTVLLAPRINFAVDLRDQVFNPQRGFYATSTLEYVYPAFANLPPIEGTSLAPPVPARTFRLLASMTGYVPIPIPLLGTIVLASNLRGGANFNTEPDFPCKVTFTNRQFFLGGAETMRGWLQDSFIPQDVLQGSWPTPDCAGTGTGGRDQVPLAQLGGDLYFLWRNELRVPLGETGLAVVLFLDLGNLWKDVRNLSPRLRGAAGLGARWLSPIGPVGVDVGFNLAPAQISSTVTEVPAAVSFTIGGI